jgi:DNA polymerase III epsilon subunit family exonuclease
MKTYVSLDTETTGLEPGSRLLEIAAIAFNERGTVLDTFETLVYPGMLIPIDLPHGIDDMAVNGKPPADIALTDLFDWMPQGAELVIHNAPFDCSIISWAAAGTGFVLPEISVIDTLAMARMIKATKKNSLQALIEHYGLIREGEAHRAMSDAEMVRQYFLKAVLELDPMATPWVTEYAYVDCAGVPNLEALPGIVKAGGLFTFTYEDMKGAVTERTILPYGWAKKGEEVYFHGLCALRGERRTFRADRILSVSLQAA